MSQISDKDRLDYAWKHFALIADQRVKTFNFYIIVLLAAFSATIGVLKSGVIPRHTFCLIGCAHIFIAGVFALIDLRGCRLLKVAADGLKEIERSEAFDGRAKLMLEDDRANKRGMRRLVSYRVAFGITFLAQAAFGLFLAWRPDLFFGSR